MVEVGGRPLLWHIMMRYYQYGHRDFAIALGYRGEYIKRWFKDFAMLEGSMTINTGTGELTRHSAPGPDWNVYLRDTGLATRTGGRVRQFQDWIGTDTFMLTWGDGVADIDLDKLLAFHREHGRLATVTAVRPPARYGHLEFDGDRVARFSEKAQTNAGWINGAYFVLEPAALDYIKRDVMWEQAPMEKLATDGELMAYKHKGYWQCMDTLREKQLLEDLWATGAAPWQNWLAE
jgi:glucose-1-phosphate cytidylyltransferase